ncbi:hypothetical protein GRJ2_000900900 [Grus japonensis]|uniref:Uncharacterized protein n=1 Tax=Grus japonensis TaxID=30415 RepID=A0ABC9WGJ5_GRUJA
MAESWGKTMPQPVVELPGLCAGNRGRLCPSQLQVQHGFLQKATKQTSSNGNVSLDASPMPLEELLGTTLTQTAKRATLQHGREANKRVIIQDGRRIRFCGLEQGLEWVYGSIKLEEEWARKVSVYEEYRIKLNAELKVEAAAEWICDVTDVVQCFIFISCDEEVGGWRLLEVPG